MMITLIITFAISSLFCNFQLTRKDGKLFGRGASDDKGPILGWLHALEAFRACGVDVPVNIRFCFEGEISKEYCNTFLQLYVAYIFVMPMFPANVSWQIIKVSELCHLTDFRQILSADVSC